MNIRIKIDVTKIDKTKLYKGEKGTYLNAVLIDKTNEYSDFMIVEDTKKDEPNGAILGNGSWIKPKVDVAQTSSQTAQDIAESDGLPF